MRTFPPDVIAALAAGEILKRVMVRLEPESGPVGFWDGGEDIDFEGVTYYGAAGRFQVSPVTSVGDNSTPAITITASNADTGFLAVLKNEKWHQRPAYLHFAFAVPGGDVWVPVQQFSGFMDTVKWSDNDDASGTVKLVVESVARNLNLKGTRVQSDNDQQALFPGDKFYEHVAQSVAVPVNWGAKGEQNP